MRKRSKARTLESCIRRLEDFLEEVMYMLGRYEVLKDRPLNKREAKELKVLEAKIRRYGGEGEMSYGKKA